MHRHEEVKTAILDLLDRRRSNAEAATDIYEIAIHLLPHGIAQVETAAAIVALEQAAAIKILSDNLVVVTTPMK